MIEELKGPNGLGMNIGYRHGCTMVLGFRVFADNSVSPAQEVRQLYLYAKKLMYLTLSNDSFHTI